MTEKLKALKKQKSRPLHVAMDSLIDLFRIRNGRCSPILHYLQNSGSPWRNPSAMICFFRCDLAQYQPLSAIVLSTFDLILKNSLQTCRFPFSQTSMSEFVRLSLQRSIEIEKKRMHPASFLQNCTILD